MTEGKDAAVLLSQGTVAEPSDCRRSWCPTDGIINRCHGFTIETWTSCKLKEYVLFQGKLPSDFGGLPLSIVKDQPFSFKTISYLCC